MDKNSTAAGTAGSKHTTYYLPDGIMRIAVNVTCGISIAVALTSAIAHYFMGIAWISVVELIQLTLCVIFWIFGFRTKRFRLAFQLALAADFIGISSSAVLGGDLFLTNIFWLALFPPLYIIVGSARVGYAFFSILMVEIFGLYWHISPSPVSVPAVILTEGFLFASAMLVFVLYMKGWQDRLQIKAAQAEGEILRIKDNKIRHLISINHEIRNPLSAIFSAVSLLKLENESSNQLDKNSKEKESVLNALQATCDHLLTVVTEPLDFERLSVKSEEINDAEYENFDPRSIALNSINVLSAKAAEKSLTVNCRVASDVHNKYRGPPSKIQQVLVNLISNAIRHSDRDITVSISDGNDCLVYAVSDLGSGISESEMETLFEPFSGHGSHGTTGLGLSISRMLVEKLMHGTISVESEVNKGTTFTVRLPLKPAAVEYETLDVLPMSRTRTPDTFNPLAGLRILVVEDDVVNNDLTSLIFSKHGMVVSSALNSTQALELLRKNGKYDLAVIDNDLGISSQLSGVALSKELRANGLTNIVGLTGNISSRLTAEWNAVGVNTILVKPTKIENILGALRELTARAKA